MRYARTTYQVHSHEPLVEVRADHLSGGNNLDLYSVRFGSASVGFSLLGDRAAVTGLLRDALEKIEALP